MMKTCQANIQFLPQQEHIENYCFSIEDRSADKQEKEEIFESGKRLIDYDLLQLDRLKIQKIAGYEVTFLPNDSTEGNANFQVQPSFCLLLES